MKAQANKRCNAASCVFKAALALCGWVGILVLCKVFTASPDYSSLRYYTLISNALVAVYFSVAAIYAALGRPAPLPVFKGALIMGITVTGIVYHTLLSDGSFSMSGADGIANQLLHTATPIMSVLDWLLFDKKGGYSKLSPFKWTLLPDIYFVLTTIYGFAASPRYYDGSRFPYFFIDFDKQGTGKVLLYVLALNVAFIALGYVFVLIDRLMARGGSGKGAAA